GVQEQLAARGSTDSWRNRPLRATLHRRGAGVGAPREERRMGLVTDETVRWLPMGALRPWHIAVLVVVLVLLFGAKRLPDAARSLGRSMRILKAETKGLAEDDVQGKADAPAGRQPLEG